MNWTEQPLTIEHPTGFSTSAILARPNHSTSGLVILCHGFLSNKNSNTNTRLTELLYLQGISTLRFDWHGMGGSGGKFEDITLTACSNQLHHLIEFMTLDGYHDLALIGSSFGGLVSIIVGASHPELKAIGLKCPVADFPEMLEQEFGLDAMEKWKQSNLIPNILGGTDPIPLKYAFFEDCCRFNAYERAKAIQAPTLIVHGDQDELVPLQQIHRLAQSLSGKKHLHLLRGANHHFAQPEDFRIMTRLLAEWMTGHLTKSVASKTISS